MKNNIILIIITLIFLISCDGLLWNGADNSSENALTISIDNLFNNSSSTGGSRFLDLGGQYIYIELARIDDQSAYNAEYSASSLPLTGDGTWEETSWGAHAILTFDISSTSIIIARFQNVPRNADIKARIILETGAAAVTNGFNGQYAGSATSPLGTTFDAAAVDLFEPVVSGPDLMDQMWVTVTSIELSSGDINFILIPGPPVV